MIRRGIGVQSFVSAGVSTDADAQAFITAAGITDATQQSAINTLVTDLKGYSIWSKMKAIYPFVGGTSSAHKWNLKDPRDLDAAFRLVFNGGGTHSSTGWRANGTNGYADTKLNTSIQYNTNNSISHGFYSRTNLYPLSINQILYDSFDNSNSNFQFYFEALTNFLFSDSYNSNSNEGRTRSTLSVTNNTGFFVSSRINTGQKIFRNNTSIGNTTTLGGIRPNLNVFISAANTNSGPVVFSQLECAFCFFGDGLTDTEAANLYTAVQAYQTTLSRNV